MATPIDDLSEGMYVAVCGYKARKFYNDDPPFEQMEPRWDGLPMKILSISLPFIAVWNGERRFALDAREIEIQQVSRKYAETLLYAAEKAPETPRGPKTPEDSRDCPRCKERLRQRLVTSNSGLTQGIATWHIVCNSCGFDGGDASTYLERLAQAKEKKTRKKKGNDDGSSVTR